MSALSGFFKESDTQLGVFYPKHYLIAVFRNLDAAREAATHLRLARFAEGEVIAVAGQDLIELAKEETGVGAGIMQALSRFFATEQRTHDQDLTMAERGAGFVAVHCPDEAAQKEAWSVLQTEAPVAARYYGNDGIEHLAGDFTTN